MLMKWELVGPAQEHLKDNRNKISLRADVCRLIIKPELGLPEILNTEVGAIIHQIL